MYFGILHLHDMQYNAYIIFSNKGNVYIYIYNKYISIYTCVQHAGCVNVYLYIYIRLDVQVGDSFAS